MLQPQAWEVALMGACVFQSIQSLTEREWVPNKVFLLLTLVTRVNKPAHPLQFLYSVKQE